MLKVSVFGKIGIFGKLIRKGFGFQENQGGGFVSIDRFPIEKYIRQEAVK